MVSRNRDGRESALAVFRSTGARDEPLTTAEVADALDCSQQAASERLEGLVEEGELARKRVGGTERVWWEPDGDGTTDAVDGVTDAVDDEGESENGRFRSLVEATEEYAIVTLDPDGHVISWNAGAERITGYEESEIVGEHFSTFYMDEEAAAGVPAENLSRALEEGSAEDEGWRVRADGSRFWASITITPIQDDDGELRGFAKVTRDTTDRREYERQLEEKNERLETRRDELESELNDVFERVSDGFVGLDDEWRITAVTDHAADVLGRPESELLGVRIWDAFDGTAGSAFEAAFREAVETQEQIHFEEYYPPLGTWFEVDAYPSESGLSVYFTDVTERKEREHELERYERIVENVPVGVYRNTPGPDGEFVAGNAELAAIFDADSVDELVGSPVSDLYTDPERRAEFSRRLMAEGVVEDYELKQETLAGRTIWISVTAMRTEEDGDVYFDGVVQDVTERKERERELERYETLFEESQDVNAIIDPDGTLGYVTPSAKHVLGYDPADLAGENVFEYIHPEDREAIQNEYAGLVEDPDHNPLVEFRFEHADGSWVVLEAKGRNLLEDPTVDGIVTYTRDATERKLFEDTLQALHESSRELIRSQDESDVSRTVVDAATSVIDLPGVVVYRYDGEAGVLTLDERSVDTDFMREALPEFPADHSSIVGHTYCDGEANYYADVRESDHLMASPDEVDMTAGLFVPLGDHGVLAVGWQDEDACDERTRRLIEILASNAEAAYTRVERERELEARARQQEVVADLGQRALGSEDLDGLFDEAVDLVTETLDSDYCKVFDLDRRAEDLVVRASAAMAPERVGSAAVDVGRQSQAGYTLLADEPIVVEDMAAEDRFERPGNLVAGDIESGISAVVGSRASPWGVLATHDTDRREFSEDDALFVQSVANILAAAVDRRDNERELEEQREHLAALDNLNGVVRDINEALVAQSTREEIEQTVCDRLADSDTYQFAWTAEVDPRTDSLTPRVEAGVEGYVADAEISVDGDRPAGQGPAGRAARSKEVQVVHDALSDPTFEPWRDVAEAYGYRSCAAIPIVHQDTLYGVLGVYTDRVGAFADEEEEVIAQLGEIIGHAIASIERKQALMSDDVVEIDVQIDDVLAEADRSVSGTITVTQTISVGDDTFLQYGTAEGEALASMESLVDELSHWEALTVLGDDSDGGEESRFELKLSEPPVVSAVADSGGYVDEARVEGDTMHVRVHLPPTIDVRRMVDDVRDTYADATLVTRQQVSRTDSRQRIERTLIEELTDRQRASLEASFHAGFFDWPRESSGEEVAESLDVTAPTFHQHLRKAQQKLLDSILT